MLLGTSTLSYTSHVHSIKDENLNRKWLCVIVNLIVDPYKNNVGDQ